MSLAFLYRFFPNLAGSNAEEKSLDDTNYNCHAWAVKVTTKRWGPVYPGYYWPPPPVPNNFSIEAFIGAFGTLGYQPCEDSSPELNYEKIAIYAFQGNVKHTARLLPNNKWTSKLGDYQDIEHVLEDLTSNHGRGYGEVVQILKRPKQDG